MRLPPSTPHPELKALIEQAKARPPMTPAELQAQRISFAFGSLPKESKTSREDVAAADYAKYGNIAAMEARLADAEAMAEALKNLGLREIVAGWNGEGRDQPYTPHPSSLGVSLKTNAGTVYALDAALEKWRAGK